VSGRRDKGDRDRNDAQRRKLEALKALEANPMARRVRPDEGVPEGTVEVTVGGWIPGSRGKRRQPKRDEGKRE
jgi:hypothetical protein